MTDTLEVFGVEYTGVTGIKATDNNGNVLTYTRGGGSPTLQTKSVSYTPTETAQSDAVTADSGYDGLDAVNVSVGAISSTYVGTGVTRKSAATITPGTTNQTIASGTYLTGTQTIAGDADLVASNIKSGVNIFGVAGTYSGGASNFVHGEFTTQSTAGVQTVTIPYTGSGHPVMAVVVVAGGAYNSAYSHWYTSVQRYAVGQWTMTKSVMSSNPTYTTSGSQNQGVTTAIYKNSTSSSTSYTRTSGMGTNVFSSSNASNAALTCVRFKGNTTLSYYVNTSSYGLLPDTDYEYFIVYSE